MFDRFVFYVCLIVAAISCSMCCLCCSALCVDRVVFDVCVNGLVWLVMLLF